MKHLKAIIFDLDGTLLDTLDDITDSVNHTLDILKLPHVNKLDVRRYLGNGAKALWLKVLEGDESLTDEALRHYLPYLEENAKVKTKPYVGILELLKKLRKTYKLAVVSNKHQKGVDEIINHYFKDYFDVVIGERDNIQKKPSPEPLLLALNLLNVSKDETLFIGDSEVDIKTAKNAEVEVIGVTWGFRDLDELIKQEPNYLINSVSNIIKIIGE